MHTQPVWGEAESIPGGIEDPPLPDALLVERARGGDADAFRQLLEQHYALIHRVAYRYLGHRQDAEDVTQDVCVKLAHAIRAFRGEADFRTWLYTLTLNACRDLGRKRRRDSGAESYAELEAFQRELSAEKVRKIAWLYREIAAFKEPLRETALLVLAEGLSHAEAGAVLGCAESTVSWRMHGIRKRLKALWEADHD